MRISLYARVSKNDESQDPQNQLNPLRDYAKALKGKVVSEYVDRASGGNGDRKEFLQMLQDADQRKFDLLLTWSLDRMSREGIENTLGYINRLKKNNIAVKSLQESWVDTSDEHLGQLLISIFAWVAQQERKRIIARIKAAHQKTKNQNGHWGRKKGSKDKVERKKSGYYKRWEKEREMNGGKK
ncbi:MAG: recombinase family protein [Candidatus Omnitrophica bacterium]|nr:recombinase family protein [Candidatus Omnitrophota bacterium]